MDLSLVALHNSFDNIQAQPSPPDFLFTAWFSVKAVKEMREHLRRNTITGIPDLDFDGPILRPGAYRNLAVRGRVLDGVV
jgi:hypothetical protein